MAAWSQILQIVGNSTLFYLSFDTHDNPGPVFIWKSEFLEDLEMWEKFESNLPVWIMVLLSECIGVLESQI